MSLWRQLTRGLSVLTNRTAADRDLDDEVRHFQEEAADAYAARGLSPADAARAWHSPSRAAPPVLHRRERGRARRRRPRLLPGSA